MGIVGETVTGVSQRLLAQHAAPRGLIQDVADCEEPIRDVPGSRTGGAGLRTDQLIMSLRGLHVLPPRNGHEFPAIRVSLGHRMHGTGRRSRTR
jgi:hypothetical protein